MTFERTSHRAFLGVSALIVALSATGTIAGCLSMSATAGMLMPGGWKVSMMWIRMPGQTWAGATTSFVAMWIAMMVAMMLPSLVPVLLRYRQAVGSPVDARMGRLTALVGIGYFFPWAGLGLAVFPMGVALTAVALQLPAFARAVPYAAGIVVLLAGALQFTAWKARHLAGWRQTLRSDGALSADSRSAWRLGMRIGLRCTQCCAGSTAILLVLGVMDLRVMAVVTAAVATERFIPSGERVAKALGVVAVGAGLFLIRRAVGTG
ncbi:MAG: DUF2182 domain-containing protein [Gemmatimonadota bacterium]|nr:DUF2182 domain-containing protein [Gemmatimonadota bacterium]